MKKLSLPLIGAAVGAATCLFVVIANTATAAVLQANVAVLNYMPSTVMVSGDTPRTANISWDVYNYGPNPATNVVVKGILPIGVEVSGLPSECAVSAANVLECTIPSLAIKTHKIYKFEALITDSIPCGPGKKIATDAFVIADQKDVYMVSRNYSLFTADVECFEKMANVFVYNKLLSSATPAEGSVMKYEVVAHNKGQDVAETVVITDAVPAGTTFRAADSSPGCSLDGSNVVCTVGTLGVTERAKFTVAFDVASDACTTVTEVSNTATATSTTRDPSPVNQVTVVTPLLCP